MKRSQGAILLARTELSQVEISERLRTERVKVGRTGVQKWLLGQSKPKTKARKALLKLFGIPIDSWDQDPPTLPSTPAADVEDLNTYDIAEIYKRDILDEARRLREDSNATPAERAKLRDQSAATLLKLAQLQDERGTKLLFHPAWRKIQNTLVNAIRPFGTDALKAVEDAFVLVHEEIGKL